MPGPVIQPGDVVKLLFPYSNPPKRKICVCICIHEGLFLVINSKPYRAAPADSQITIFKEELPCLDYDSYLDASKPYIFERDEINKGMKGGIFRLAESAIARMKTLIQGQGYLPRNYKQLVLKNL